jgi:protein tyrosine/serine phosphatase
MTRSLRPLVTLALLVALAGWRSPLAALPQAQTVPAAPAEKLERAGLPNLGQVSSTLYRGAQPKAEGYDELQKMGVHIVVNLRNDASEEERQQVEARGMRYVAIPWSGWRSPDNQQVAQFLRLLRENRGQKVFVHCQRGAERTGVMVAAYLIAEQGWTPEQALDEMEEFKFRGFWFRHLKRYVRNFPALLTTDPALQPFRPAPACAR